MILKNANRKGAENKLMEIKEAVMSFDINFDKRTRAGLPSCWDQQNNFLYWERYETLLVEAKS